MLAPSQVTRSTAGQHSSSALFLVTVGRRFAAALLPRLFGTNPRSHHKGATGRVRTGDQRLPVLCHCQLGQDIPVSWYCSTELIKSGRAAQRTWTCSSRYD